MQILKLKNLSSLILLVACSLVIFSCEKDEDSDPMDCVTENLTYDNWAGEFISSTCALSGCHAEGTTATFEMFNYATTSVAVGFGRISGAINREQGFSAMPKDRAKLSDCNISKMEAWIADGAPEN